MTHPQADIFFENLSNWKEELTLLRKIVLSCGLTEDFKWKHPCYTHHGKNIVIIHGFKEYCALLFFKGALLQDEQKLLIQQTENVREGRQIRFSKSEEIIAIEATLKAYIFEAIEIEKIGLKIPPKKTEEFPIPAELEQKWKEDTAFKSAFEKLTPGRQRGYLLHFNQASQAKTRETRIEKYKQRILDGKGLNDCICGLSKKMPNCDGSHKQLKS
jgi:uncharacterized protein YdeI (YjbR/CyaY-like superfamily)